MTGGARLYRGFKQGIALPGVSLWDGDTVTVQMEATMGFSEGKGSMWDAEKDGAAYALRVPFQVPDTIQPGQEIVVDVEMKDPDGFVTGVSVRWPDARESAPEGVPTGAGSCQGAPVNLTLEARVARLEDALLDALENPGKARRALVDTIESRLQELRERIDAKILASEVRTQDRQSWQQGMLDDRIKAAVLKHVSALTERVMAVERIDSAFEGRVRRIIKQTPPDPLDTYFEDLIVKILDRRWFRRPG